MEVALVFFGLFSVVEVYSVPPSICFEKFKWQDCGLAPKAVVYYYASGSRCEVGLWRGCLPNRNMFLDEYECVQSCIFSLRANPEDYHNVNAENQVDSQETTTELLMITGDASGNSTSTGENATETGGDNEVTDASGGEATTMSEATGGDGDGGDPTTAGEAQAADGETTAPDEAAAGDPTETPAS